jgi:HTH-type transcriptional regulator/antitoxin HigA
MKYTVIKNEKQYNKTINRLEQIFDAKKSTHEGDELELLL